MKAWAAVGLVVLIGLGLYFAFRDSGPEKTPQDYKIDTLVAYQRHLRDSMQGVVDDRARERDSALKVSDARGDSIVASKVRQSILRDSIEALIGSAPTAFTFDSARCNIALRLSLQENGELTQQRDICARDRQELRQQLVKDSTEFRQAIAKLIFNTKELEGAVRYEREKPRPCKVDLLVVKPKCGTAMATTGLLGLLLGLLN